MTKIMFNRKTKIDISTKECSYSNKITTMFWTTKQLDYDTERFSKYLSTLNQFVIVKSIDTQQKRDGKTSYFCNNLNPKQFKSEVEKIANDSVKYNCREVSKK